MCVLINRDLQCEKNKRTDKFYILQNKIFFFIIHIKDIKFLSLLDDQKKGQSLQLVTLWEWIYLLFKYNTFKL